MTVYPSFIYLFFFFVEARTQLLYQCAQDPPVPCAQEIFNNYVMNVRIRESEMPTFFCSENLLVISCATFLASPSTDLWGCLPGV